jgi:hypothetical protein
VTPPSSSTLKAPPSELLDEVVVTERCLAGRFTARILCFGRYPIAKREAIRGIGMARGVTLQRTISARGSSNSHAYQAKARQNRA